MIRQFCPHCLKSVELPETAAGCEAPCPSCGKSFAVPDTYAIQVDPGTVKSIPALPPAPELKPVFPPLPAPPIDSNRPVPPPGYSPPPGAATVPTFQYAGSMALSLSPAVLGWMVAIGFAAILVLMFFPWSGAYPGGLSAYTQSFWGALGNGISADTSAEQVMKQEATLEKALRSDWWLLLPYLLAILFGVAVAWTDRLVTVPDFAYRIGPFGMVRAMIWPRRGMILFVLAAVALTLFTFESIRGFGLESAVRTVSVAEYKDEADKVDNTADRQKVRAKIGVKQASFGMQSGYAYWLVGLTHLAVLLSAGGRLWLDARGEGAPHPRLVAEW